MLRVSETLVDWLIKSGRCSKHGSKEYYAHNAAQLLYDGTLSGEDYKEFSKADEYDDTPNGTKSYEDEDVIDGDELDKILDDGAQGDVKSRISNLEKSITQLRDVLTDEGDDMTAEKLFAGRNGGSISVKTPSGQYCEKRYDATNKHGLKVFDPIYQRNVMTQSERSKAHAGVLLKHLAYKAGVTGAVLSEHERELLNDLAMSKEWAGQFGGDYSIQSGGIGVKTLIDDVVSGGLEIAPIEFDNDVYAAPLLNGELFPMVDLKPISRGRRIEGASIQTPTMSWGGVDGTDISLFNTAAMVAAIDTTVFAIDGAVEIGRDFLSDSPVNVGQTLTGLVGERLSNELDKVIASGNGTTQPEGIFTATGLTTVTTTNGNAGPPVLADYLSLLFSIAKQYRTAANRVCFISNDTSYQRSRGMKVDPANPSTDQRAVLNPTMDNFGGSLVNAYATLGYPHKVENNIGNASAAVVAMSRYRMYRRLGLEMRFETGGKALARANTVLLVFRARFGGRLMDSNAAAKWTNGQS